MSHENIYKKIVDDFNENFLKDFKGESDPEKILFFKEVLDNPYELAHQVADIPSKACHISLLY